MTSLPRTECPACGRDVAITRTGLTYRHDPATGRTADLQSCHGSLRPVRAPGGGEDLVLFLSPGDGEMPEPSRLF